MASAAAFVAVLHGFAMAFAVVDFEQRLSALDFMVAFVATVDGYTLPWGRTACHLVGWSVGWLVG